MLRGTKWKTKARNILSLSIASLVSVVHIYIRTERFQSPVWSPLCISTSEPNAFNPQFGSRCAYLYQNRTLSKSTQFTFHSQMSHKQTIIFRLRTGHCRLRSHMKKIGIVVSPLPLRTGNTNYKQCPAVMPSPQKKKGNHLANRKFPRKHTPWNSHRPTPDGAVHRPDGTPNITNLHRTLMKKNKPNGMQKTLMETVL